MFSHPHCNLIKTNQKKSISPNECQLADLRYSTGGPPEFLMLGDGQVITSCLWLFSTRLSPMFIVNYLPLKAVIASLMFPHHKFDLHCFLIYLHVLLYSLKCFILKEDNGRMEIEQKPKSCLKKYMLVIYIFFSYTWMALKATFWMLATSVELLDVVAISASLEKWSRN